MSCALAFGKMLFINIKGELGANYGKGILFSAFKTVFDTPYEGSDVYI